MEVSKADEGKVNLDANKRVNPFVKLANNMERIADALNNDQPLSSLKDIKFVQPT